MDELFIQDGYTKQHSIAAVAGLHPAVEVVFRPALPKERTAYAAKLASRDADQVEKYECELIARHVLEFNGKPRADWEPRLGRLVPAVRQNLIDTVLGYTPAREVADVKN